MIITYHAAQRFLERAMGKLEFSHEDLCKTKSYLNRVFKDVVPNSYARSFALPGFEKDYYVIHFENRIITIIPKNEENK